LPFASPKALAGRVACAIAAVALACPLATGAGLAMGASATTTAPGGVGTAASTRAGTTGLASPAGTSATRSGTPTGTGTAGGSAPAGGTGTTTYVPSGGTPAVPTAPTTTITATPPTTGLPTLGRSGTPFTRSLATPSAHRSRHRISTLAILLLALAALLVLVLVAWVAVRRRAHDPHWWLALRHSFAEAGLRTSATWAEFSDWVRLGR
jgi:hypothetical protein